MQFLPKGIAVLAAVLIAVPAAAQMDKDDKKKSAKGEAMKSEAMTKGADGTPRSGDAMKPRSPDVTGKPPMNSPSANTTPAPRGPGVNPNVEDKSPAAKQANKGEAKARADDKKKSDGKKSDDRITTK